MLPSSPSSQSKGNAERLQTLFCSHFGREHFPTISELLWFLLKKNHNAFLCGQLLSIHCLPVRGLFWITMQGTLFAICTKILLLVVTHSEVPIISKAIRAVKISSCTGKEIKVLSRAPSNGVSQSPRRAGAAYLCGMPVVQAVVCSLDRSQSFRYQFISTSRSREDSTEECSSNIWEVKKLLVMRKTALVSWAMQTLNAVINVFNLKIEVVPTTHTRFFLEIIMLQ